jgi:hypothetical protein
MPNWCSNNLVLTHEDPAMIKRAYDALERGEFLQEFIPVPQELKDTVADGSTNESLIEKHGYSSWYDYCVGEWGTKWDCGEQGCSDIHPEGTMLHTSFDTAWGPPVNAYEKLADMGFGVEAMYYEGGMGFAGTWSDGVDDYVEFDGMSADDIEREYPELDECFGISECMREYEEPEEELTTWIREGGEKLGLVEKA